MLFWKRRAIGSGYAACNLPQTQSKKVHSTSIVPLKRIVACAGYDGKSAPNRKASGLVESISFVANRLKRATFDECATNYLQFITFEFRLYRLLMRLPNPENTTLMIVRTAEELNEVVCRLRKNGKRIGLVPTMGALHAGHLSLVHACREQCDATIVSIFVNPTQFAPGEDLTRYPRSIASDLRMLSDANVDVVFMPEAADVYPPGCSTNVEPPRVAAVLEGESRPTHFRGVATVVLKLFNMTRADVAFFGQKDYQQSLVIRHMVRDLNVPIDIVVCPIVRDDNGLALSSRNVFLSSDERVNALSLSRTLGMAEKMIRQGENDARIVMAEMTQALIEGGVTEIDYAVVADANTLQWLDEIRLPVVLLVAARVGTTRLIDNVILN